ncbi:MAG: hypothetical protein EOO56_18890 [Hymenobacter sp.]|nr:MAG: hypothetical protein EOO56_18890 [Hymenobacter sp.]
MIALADISDEYLFTKGAVFRKLNKEHDINANFPAHYDYMLISHPDEEETMMFINVTFGSIKAGYIASYVKADQFLYRATGEEIKRSLGTERVFYCEH